MNGRDLYSALHTEAGGNAILSVEVEGAEPVLAVAREIQRHPVRGEITHLDLIKVSLDVAIEALRDYRRRRVGTIDDLMRAAKVSRVHRVMQPYVEAVT